MENRINVKIKQCYDTEENYKINNPVLLAGQLAYTKDKYGKYKIGDGISHWNDLTYTDNVFIGTQKEYEEKNAAGEITPGTIVYITDDNDYCNVTIDKELSGNSQNLVENQAVAKALKINETKDNTVTFNEADKRENINTGEKHSVIFGKIKKYFSDLKNVAFSNSYNDLDDQPSIPPEVAVKGDAEKEYRQGNVNLTAENIGALPADGTAAASLSIENHFDTRPSSLNIDFASPQFQHKITYMIADVSEIADDSMPPVDSHIINTGWDSSNWGSQLALSCTGSGNHAYMRTITPTGQLHWTEFLTNDIFAVGRADLATVNNANGHSAIYNLDNAGTLVSGYGNFWHVLHMGEYSGSQFGSQIVMPYVDSLSDSEMFIRTAKGADWRTFRRVAHNGNINSMLYFNSTSSTDLGIDNTSSNYIGYTRANLFGQTDGALYKQVYSNLWVHEIFGDYRTGQIAVRGKNNGTWQGWRTVLDSINYNQYALPRRPEHTNELNCGGWSITGATEFNFWFNYRDCFTDGKASTLISTYIFGNGNSTSDSNNRASILAKNGSFEGFISPQQGTIIAHETGTMGTAGYIKIAQIQIISSYVNGPCIFVIGSRGRTHPVILSIYFNPADHHDPSLNSFYQIGDHSYWGYLHKESTSVWGLYMQKNEPYGRIQVFNAYLELNNFKITYPNTQVSSLPSGSVKANIGGTVYRSYLVRDAGDGRDLYFNYSASAMAHTSVSWLGAWNGNTLQAVARNSFMGEIHANGYWGLAPNGDASQWIRTSTQGIIPYQPGGRGSGHSYLGTDSWYFGNSYIDNMYGVNCDLSGSLVVRNTAMNIAGGLCTQVELNTTRVFKDGIAISNPGTRSDQGWIRVTGSGESNTVLEIATGDDGGSGEQIVCRQYNTSNAVSHQAILMNTAGNQQFNVVYGTRFESSLTSSTWINANRGNVLLNSTAAAGYNGLIRAKSSNGVFTESVYLTEWGLQYTTDSTISAGTNSTTKRAVLLNESGNSSFPGQVSASNFSASGSSSFTTATITNLTVNGSMRLKNSGNYGMKLNFGDGDYVYLYEGTDDHLTIYAKEGVKIDGPLTADDDATVMGQLSVLGKLFISGKSSTYIESSTSSVMRLRADGGYEMIVTGDSWIQLFSTGTNHNGQGVSVRLWAGTSRNEFTPKKDNDMSLGYSDMRWKQLYAATTSIATSDRTKKKEISYMGEALKYKSTYLSDEIIVELIKRIKPCIFKFKENDSNRPHHGMIAQDIEELLKDLGIKDHAAFIKSPKFTVIDHEDGSHSQEIIEGEYDYGLRYEEFIADIIRFIQISYSKIEEQEKKIQKLETRLSDIETKLYKILNAA